VLHSKVRSSRPRLPGEIRVNPILCLQVGHDGRSAMELLITTRHSEANDRYGQTRSVRLRILSDKILAQLLRGGEPELKIGIGSAGHGWMRDRHGLGPEAPLSPKGGVVLVWVHQTCCQPISDNAPRSKRGPTARAISENGRTPRGGRFCYPCAFICIVAPLSLRVGAISPSSQSCS
jgi:hypothetical protein